MTTMAHPVNAWIPRIRSRIQLTLVAATLLALILLIYRLSGDATFNDTATEMRVQRFEMWDTTRERTSNDNNLSPPSIARIKAGSAMMETVSAIGTQRIVHLDLKGAPPRVSYLAELFPLLHKLGATGVLMEYEDMFPFWGPLSDIPAFNCYSRADISEIVKLAARNHLDVIPLIQTFGHMEFVLKLRSHSKLREVYKYPQAICPSHNATFPLLSSMVEQVIQLHPHSKRLHIGCDEVYQLGDCPRCVSAMGQERWGKVDLFLSHVSRVASLVATRGVKPLVWDDELRRASPEQLRAWGLPGLVTPVVWKYTPDVSQQLPADLWSRLSESNMHPVLAATAFKGASGPDQDIPDVSYHLDNHRSWLQVASTAKREYGVNFHGVILTGWQRYDHFSVLCELLPTALPSLAANLALLAGADSDIEALSNARAVLGCQGSIEMLSKLPSAGLHCNFPGSDVMEVVARLRALKKDLARLEAEPTVRGWMSHYNLVHVFSNPVHVEHATTELDRCRAELQYIERDMRTAMAGVYDRYTADEWVRSFIEPVASKLKLMWEGKEKLLTKDEWPRRPLDIKSDKDSN